MKPIATSPTYGRKRSIHDVHHRRSAAPRTDDRRATKACRHGVLSATKRSLAEIFPCTAD